MAEQFFETMDGSVRKACAGTWRQPRLSLTADADAAEGIEFLCLRVLTPKRECPA